ncbi:hypothetical protein [Mucilaginibacter aquaedulcis]|uniref:hypothetical protein n=1 Tax=Mucilaginibacter aquaedulcis TaxID=1187081 RepID=UPI0025B34213|nr:hypothetical protein [Mucilaginibacter aquaedulcis]MDN3548705.1 hypothetical protein [Mucilaginibacter aquaedulcis]
MKSLKTKTRLILTLLFVVIIGLISCKKESTTNPAAGSAAILFGVKADQVSSSLVSASVSAVNATTAMVNWTEGIANVSKFEFEARKNGIKKEIEVKGLTNVDLFALAPSFANAPIDTGVYNEIEVKVVLAKSNAAIPLTLKGNLTKTDGTVIPVELYFNEDLEIKAEAKNVTIEKASDLKTTIMLHLNGIFQQISIADLQQATLTDGKIIISSTSNNVIYNKVKVNIQQIAETEFEHRHHDGSDDNGGDDNHGGTEGHG